MVPLQRASVQNRKFPSEGFESFYWLCMTQSIRILIGTVSHNFFFQHIKNATFPKFQLKQCEDIAKRHSKDGNTKVHESQLIQVIPQTALDHFN